MPPRIFLALLALALPLEAQRSLRATRVADNLENPTGACAPVGDEARLFVTEQAGNGQGRVRVLDLTQNPPALQTTPYLTVAPIQAGGEEGLLGLAFHPAFATNGYFFVFYTDTNGNDRVVRYRANAPYASSSTADPASATAVLTIDHPGAANHNGGALAFGPDGHLYIGFGDGGVSHGIGKEVLWEAFNVPAAALGWDTLAQDTESLFGKVLRIDVDRGFPGYAVPRDNPFAAGGGRREVFAWGFRNPFRLAFDRADGSFYVTAVAETLWEAAYRVSRPGNYGWPLREGTRCVDRLRPREPPAACPTRDAAGNRIEMPVLEYPNMQASHPETRLGIRGVGTAITGAVLYRGRAIPALAGRLVVSDWSADFKKPSGQIFVGERAGKEGALWPYRKALQLDSRIIGLAQDGAGEIYVLTNETLGPYGATGKIHRLVSDAR